MQITIKTEDGFPLKASVFNSEQPSKGVLVIAAGLGIPRQFYRAFAEYAATKNYQTITFDYRGIGQSVSEDFSGQDLRMQDWGTQDIDAVLKHAISEHPNLPLYYLAHSAGGQLLGLAEYSKKVKASCFIASTLPHKKYMSGITGGLQLFMLWNVLLPTLAFLSKEMVPARKLGLSTVDVPKGVIKEWASWGRTEGYLFNKEHDIDTRRYQSLSLPIFVKAIVDDKLAPPASCFALAERYPNAQVTNQTIIPSEHNLKGVGHFGFFRKANAVLWDDVLNWLSDQ